MQNILLFGVIPLGLPVIVGTVSGVVFVVGMIGLITLCIIIYARAHYSHSNPKKVCSNLMCCQYASAQLSIPASLPLSTSPETSTQKGGSTDDLKITIVSPPSYASLLADNGEPHSCPELSES